MDATWVVIGILVVLNGLLCIHNIRKILQRYELQRSLNHATVSIHLPSQDEASTLTVLIPTCFPMSTILVLSVYQYLNKDAEVLKSSGISHITLVLEPLVFCSYVPVKYPHDKTPFT